ncbi:MAG: diguanylate cyclase, partial [Burkholderiales bacterium]|nr:diguanylate cyclase [Burkholderiales bacterium]
GHLLIRFFDSERDFVGHVGGDDFVLLLQSEDWKARCEATLAAFDHEVVQYFDAPHIETKGYVTQDRLGREAFHPLVSLSLGAVPVSAHRFLGHRELAAALADVKKQAKATHGSALFVDRRSQTNTR